MAGSGRCGSLRLEVLDRGAPAEEAAGDDRRQRAVHRHDSDGPDLHVTTSERTAPLPSRVDCAPRA